MAAATSMAAALAASLPAPQSAPAPSAPTYEAIPASMAKVIDIEAEITITSVQLDAMVSRPIHEKSGHLHPPSRIPHSHSCAWTSADPDRLAPAGVLGRRAHAHVCACILRGEFRVPASAPRSRPVAKFLGCWFL